MDLIELGRLYRDKFRPHYLEPQKPLVIPIPGKRFTGTILDHCDICPKPHGEECRTPCDEERNKLKQEDGVTVIVC